MRLARFWQARIGGLVEQNLGDLAAGVTSRERHATDETDPLAGTGKQLGQREGQNQRAAFFRGLRQRRAEAHRR